MTGSRSPIENVAAVVSCVLKASPGGMRFANIHVAEMTTAVILLFLCWCFAGTSGLESDTQFGKRESLDVYIALTDRMTAGTKAMRHG
jgi:hypothetical protein